MRTLRTVILTSILVASSAYAVDWFTLLDWETPQCVESGGPITSGPIADLYEYKEADDAGVVVAYAKSSGKIGGVYFRGRAACEKHARKYQQMWLKDRNE